MSWHHIDSVVFGPAVAPAVGTTGYNQLILTPHVPVDVRVGVMLIVEDMTTGSNYFAFRPSDDDDDYLDPTNGPHGLSTGISLGVATPDPTALAVITFTGPTAPGGSVYGVVDWVAHNIQSARVTLAGWFDADFSDVLLFDSGPIIPPNVWQKVPGLDEAVKKLVFLKFRRSTGSSGAVGLRTVEPLGDPPPWWEPDASYAGGSTIHQANAFQIATLAALSTGSTGLAEWQATAPSPLISAWLSYCNYEPWRPCNCQIYALASSPTVWTDLDLSSVFGRRHVLCAIEVRHEVGVTGVPNNYAFRAKGASWDTLGGATTQSPGGCSRTAIERVSVPPGSAPRRRMVWVESNHDGIIQWISSSSDFGVVLYLQGWIEGAVGVRISLVGAPFPPDYQISLSITDDTQVILSSIYVSLIAPDGVTEYAVIEGSDWNPPWDGTITPNAENGYDILITDIGTLIGLYVVGDWNVVVSADVIGGGSIITQRSVPIDTAVPTVKVFDLSQGDVVIPDDTRMIRFRIADLWGFGLETLGLVAIPKVPRTKNLDPGKQGTEVIIINEGVIQAPFTGTIISNGDFLGYDVIVRGLPDFYDPCTWSFTWTGESIVEKSFAESSLL